MGANPNIYNNVSKSEKITIGYVTDFGNEISPWQDKETPVLIAIGLDEEEILLELLDSGADPNMVNVSYKTFFKSVLDDVSFSRVAWL